MGEERSTGLALPIIRRDVSGVDVRVTSQVANERKQKNKTPILLSKHFFFK